MTLARSVAGLLFRDQFQRADGLPGANWVSEAGVWTIINGELVCGSAGESVLRCEGFAARADQHIQCVMKRSTIGSYLSLFGRRAGGAWYLVDIGATGDGSDPNSMRMYRQSGGYTRISGGWARNMAQDDVYNRVTMSVIGATQKGWVDQALTSFATDGTIVAPGGIALDFYAANGGTATVKDFIVCTSRTVTVTGLPAGYKIRVGGSTLSAASDGATPVSVDIAGSVMPCAAQVLDATGTPVDGIAGVFGGDTWAYAASAAVSTVVPPRNVTGLLFADDFTRANGPVGNGWTPNSFASGASATIVNNELQFSGGADGATLGAPPDQTEFVSQFKYDHGVNGGDGGWNSAYNYVVEDGYLFYFSSANLQVYRRAAGAYPMLANVARAHPGGTKFRYKTHTMPGEQQIWSDADDVAAPRYLWANVRDVTLQNVGKVGPRLGTNPTFPGTLWDDVILYRSNRVRVVGLPAGYIAAIAGYMAVADATGEAIVDLGPAFCPATLMIFNAAGAPVRAVPNVYGGDEFQWAVPVAPPALPAVPGVLRLDINPALFGISVRQDGEPLVAGNTTPSLTHLGNPPVFRRNMFPMGNPAIRTSQPGNAGCYVPRPVEDDFTIYAVITAYLGSGNGTLWYQHASLIDCELAGTANDFGVNLRADGRLIAGTGNPDVSTNGTKNMLDGKSHLITIKRVKATGRFQVYVDGVLDIDFVGSTATLSAQAQIFFGSGASVGRATADYGRVLAYNAAHSDADRALVETALYSQYLAIPTTPSAVTTVGGSSLKIATSAYNNPGTPHASTQWQLTLATDPAFAAPVLDVVDPVNLTSLLVPSALRNTKYIARARHTSTAGKTSSWSNVTPPISLAEIGGKIRATSTIGLGPTETMARSNAGPAVLGLSRKYDDTLLTFDSLVVNPAGFAGTVGESIQRVPGTGGPGVIPLTITMDKPIRSFTVTLVQIDYLDNKISVKDASGTVIASQFFNAPSAGRTQTITIDVGDNLIRSVELLSSLSDWIAWQDLAMGVDHTVPAPAKPTLTLERLSRSSVTMTGSPIVSTEPHVATQWQLTRSTDPTWTTFIHDSGESPDLTVHVASGLLPVAMIGRVRYKSTLGGYSAWSDNSAELAAPPPSTVTPPGYIPTPVLFPFEPDGAEPIHETVVYKTDVLTSHQDDEQRIALRRRPALRLKWRVTTMMRGEAGWLAGLLWKNISNRWQVPLWMNARRVTAIVGGVYSVDMTDARWNHSGKVLVWRDSATCDVMTYVAQDATTVTLAGATSFAHAAAPVYLVPLGVGALAQSYDLERAAIVATGMVEFELDTTNSPLLTPLAPAQSYKGIEVLTLHPDTQDGTEHEAWTLSSERSGGELGPFVHRAYGASPVVSRPKYWVLSTSQERATFRRWLEARRGRKVPLWIPTYQDDLTLAAPALAGAGWIDIAPVGFADQYFGSSARTHVAFLLPDRTVVPATVSVTDLVGGNERLFLEAPLSVAVPVSARVSLLVLARLAEDAVTLDHYGPTLTTVTTGFTELPRETP